MKIKDGFVLREAAGSYVVMNIGGELSFNGMITLNETGAFIWRAVESGDEVDAIAQKMVEKYGIDLETAITDAQKFIDKMNGAGVLE